MDDGAELLVGELFQSLAEEGRTETREALLDVYQNSAVREREAALRCSVPMGIHLRRVE